MEKYKILSLDGGGSWALLQSMALEAIYKGSPVGTRCGAILKDFHLIVANSGGSLMLAAMIENINGDISDVTKMFLDSSVRDRVFSPLKWTERINLGGIAKLLGFGPKYKASRKLIGLESILRDTHKVPLWQLKSIRNDIPDNIIICGFDYDRNRATFFRTNQLSKSRSENPVKYEYTLAHAVHAASNAPVLYFDEPAKFKIGRVTHQLWDGAVGGNNNPVLIGITEALAELKEATTTMDSLRVLSIGTGNNLIPVKGFTDVNLTTDEALLMDTEKANFAGSVKKMAQSIISEPPDAANYMAHMFLDGGAAPKSIPKIVRLNPLIQPVLNSSNTHWDFPSGISTLDEKNTFKNLIELDMDATEDFEVQQIEQLGKWWIEGKVRNQPIRIDSMTLESSIGYSDFQKGKDEWLKRRVI